LFYEDRTHTISVTTRGADHYTKNNIELLKNYKTKNPLDFHLRGFGKTKIFSYLLSKPSLFSYDVSVHPHNSGR
jgi:hypothetical protein